MIMKWLLDFTQGCGLVAGRTNYVIRGLKLSVPFLPPPQERRLSSNTKDQRFKQSCLCNEMYIKNQKRGSGGQVEVPGEAMELCTLALHLVLFSSSIYLFLSYIHLLKTNKRRCWGPLIYSKLVRSIDNNLDFQQATESTRWKAGRGPVWMTEPSSYGIWTLIWVKSIWIELNSWTSSYWCLRITC